MMWEPEGVMRRLADQTEMLKAQLSAPPSPSDADRDLTVRSLAVVSEAVLKIGRDIRQIRLQLADRNS